MKKIITVLLVGCITQSVFGAGAAWQHIDLNDGYAVELHGVSYRDKRVPTHAYFYKDNVIFGISKLEDRTVPIWPSEAVLVKQSLQNMIDQYRNDSNIDMRAVKSSFNPLAPDRRVIIEAQEEQKFNYMVQNHPNRPHDRMLFVLDKDSKKSNQLNEKRIDSNDTEISLNAQAEKLFHDYLDRRNSERRAAERPTNDISKDDILFGVKKEVLKKLAWGIGVGVTSILGMYGVYTLIKKWLNPTLPFEFKAGNTKIVIKKGTITHEDVDAIVNAANSNLEHAGGVAYAISMDAGDGLQQASDALPKINGVRCPVGGAVTTDAFDLKSRGIKKIIHAVGPDCRLPEQEVNKENLLRNAYYNSLKEARKYNLKSIAFPAISTAIFGYDIKEATPVAIGGINKFIQQYPDALQEIRLILFKAEQADVELYQKECARVFGSN